MVGSNQTATRVQYPLFLRPNSVDPKSPTITSNTFNHRRLFGARSPFDPGRESVDVA